MIKKIFVKLISSWDRMVDVSKQQASLERELAEERRQQIMANREAEGKQKYVSEITTPTEKDLRGPSNSALKEGSK